jgi:hypothetical protein
MNFAMESTSSNIMSSKKVSQCLNENFINVFIEQGKPKEPTKEIIVGKWDESIHLEWAKNRQNVKHAKELVKTGGEVKAGKTIHGDDGFPISVWDSEDQIDEVKEVNGDVQEVELWYSEGEVCDITKRPREVLVRLKVKESTFKSLLIDFSASLTKTLSRSTF